MSLKDAMGNPLWNSSSGVAGTRVYTTTKARGDTCNAKPLAKVSIYRTPEGSYVAGFGGVVLPEGSEQIISGERLIETLKKAEKLNGH